MALKALNSFSDNSFAAACYNDNSIDELIDALTNYADTATMKDWEITSEIDYRQQIGAALKEKIKESSL